MNNQTGWDWFCTGNRTSSAQQVKYVGNTDAFCFGFYFMSPKWTKTKIVIEINSPATGLFLSSSCTGGLWMPENGPEVLIEISLVLVAHRNEDPFQHVLVCIFVIKGMKM